MKRPGVLRLFYMLFAFLTLLYTFFGLLISLNAGAGTSDATFEASYKIGTDSASLGLFILVTGIPMFLLFIFLYWRSSRINAPKNSDD
jgi:uncharacterized BrkB/YihY/UPF0761 family membrane protein